MNRTALGDASERPSERASVVNHVLMRPAEGAIWGPRCSGARPAAAASFSLGYDQIPPKAQRPVRQQNPPTEGDRTGSPSFLTECAWCGRFKLGGEWVKRRAVRAHLGLGVRDPFPLISHGMCPPCAKRNEN